MVSIIILSYNTCDLLKACLTSLFSSVDLKNFEVLVIDNASQDDSVSMVEKHFPKVRIIQNKGNNGFAKGCNIGAKHAKGDLLLFLNSDTELTEKNIQPLVELFAEDEQVAVAGGKFLNTDKTIQRSFGSFYTIPSVFLMLLFGDKGELLRNTSDTLQYVDWVSGGFMLVRRDVFEKLNGFDEHFFMYIEDMEFCFRVRRAGYEVAFYPKAVVKHVGHGSSNRAFAIVHIYKGLGYFYKKHGTKWSHLFVRMLLKVKAIILIGVGKVTRNASLTQTYEKALAVS